MYSMVLFCFVCCYGTFTWQSCCCHVLQVALLSGWQNIAELLIKNGASTSTVTADMKAAITCPDCKRIVATYNL
jgi:hypothetical protein